MSVEQQHRHSLYDIRSVIDFYRKTLRKSHPTYFELALEAKRILIEMQNLPSDNIADIYQEVYEKLLVLAPLEKPPWMPPWLMNWFLEI